MGFGDRLTWGLLVEERNTWVAHNFPDPDGSRTPLDSILGCIEELGELTHHHLKQVQSIRGDDDHHEMEAQDAIGDLSVYLLGVMSYFGTIPTVHLSGEKLLGTKSTWDSLILTLAKTVYQLPDLLNEDPDNAMGRARATRAINQIVRVLHRYCQARGWDYPGIVMKTWRHVSQRDWIKYPDTGRPPE